jgi:biopolymer transport protein ExbD
VTKGFESHRRPAPTINLSALIDVVFILVIFIVLAANFDRIRNLDVTLPEAEAASLAQAESMSITVRADGSLEVDDAPVHADELRQRLTERGVPGEPVIIFADGDVAFERAVWVLGEASAAGFSNVSIATRQPPAGGGGGAR